MNQTLEEAPETGRVKESIHHPSVLCFACRSDGWTEDGNGKENQANNPGMEGRGETPQKKRSLKWKILRVWVTNIKLLQI